MGEGALQRDADSCTRFFWRASRPRDKYFMDDDATRLSTAYSVCGVRGCNECREFHPARHIHD